MDQGGQTETWRSLVPALSLALCTALFLLGLNLRNPMANEPVALFFDPTADNAQALQQIDQLKGEVMNFAKHVRAA